MGKIDWRRAAAVTVTAAGAGLALYLLCKYAFLLFLPFLFAFALAYLTREPVLALQKRTKCPEALAAVLVTLGVLVLIGLCLTLLCVRLLLELQNFLAFLARDSADPGGEIARFLDFFRKLGEDLPFLAHLRNMEFLHDLIGDPKTYLIEQLQQSLAALTGSLAEGLAVFLRRLPGMIFCLLITLISCFYAAVGYEDVKGALLSRLPRSVAERVPAWSRKTKSTLKRCVKAYFLLFLLTLGELTLGLLILRVDYPFLIAFLVALLDILPVFGVGTVLLPWGIFALAAGHAFRGVGLLVLYAVIAVARQFVEPRLVGKSLGVHPLLMLVSFYAGLRLFGAPGLILGPVTALLLKSLIPPRRPDLDGKEENIE